MATAEDNTTSMNDDLDALSKCAVCLDYYKDPRVLPCSHTFCYECIRDLCKNGNVHCPMRDNFLIHRTHIAHLPINRIARDLVENLVNSQQKQPTTNTEAKCGHCNEISSEYYCRTCSKMYCTFCLQSEHELEDFETHKIDVLINDNLAVLCTDHVDEKLKYYCTECEQLVCSDCLLFQHKQHLFIRLGEIVQETQKKFDLSMQQLLSMKENLKKRLETTRTSYFKHQKAHLQTKNEIEQMISNLQKLLDTRKQQLIDEAENNYTIDHEMIGRQYLDIVAQLKIILIRLLFTKQISSTGNPYQIVQMKNDLISYNALLNEQYDQLTKAFMFDTTHFVAGDSLSSIQQLLDKLGNVSTAKFLVDSVEIRLSSLKLSQLDITEKYMALDDLCAYGYRFQLATPLKLRAVRVKSTLFDNDLSVYILDHRDLLIQTTTIQSNNENSTMTKWITIPITCEINNNYYVFVGTTSKEQKSSLIAYQCCNHSLRIINDHVSVRSKRALMEKSMSFDIGTKFNVVYDALLCNDDALNEAALCIDMILDT